MLDVLHWLPVRLHIEYIELSLWSGSLPAWISQSLRSAERGLWWFRLPIQRLCWATHSFIRSFIHSGYFYSASSSPLLLRSAPDTAQILFRSFTPRRHRQLRVKDLPKVLAWRLERDLNPLLSGRKALTTKAPPRPTVINHSGAWLSTSWHSLRWALRIGMTSLGNCSCFLDLELIYYMVFVKLTFLSGLI